MCKSLGVKHAVCSMGQTGQLLFMRHTLHALVRWAAVGRHSTSDEKALKLPQYTASSGDGWARKA